jgi:hypothetical protein
LLNQALKRPLNYHKMIPQRQWEIDKSLGILDWDPDENEINSYATQRAEQGDEFCVRYLQKLERKNGKENGKENGSGTNK